jgi:trafficking protein particle complex subunit 2
MDSRSPSVACIGFIGRSNNPLHISLFPATGTGYEADRDKLQYSFMLNSCLDIFEARMPTKGLTQDFGLLHALDERIAMYGWLTNTGVKIVIVVDMEGSPAEGGKMAAGLGLRNSDLTPVCLVIGIFSVKCANPRFIKEVERIGRAWYPGIGAM